MKFFAAADGFSLLIFLGVVIASAIANWLKRRRGETDEETATPPPIRRERREIPAPSRAASWEEEIRRMLEGATAEPPPSPPPIVIAAPERPRPRPVSAPSRSEPAPVATAPVRLPVPDIFARAGRTEETESHEAHPTEHMAELRESESALARASQLHEVVARRLEAVDRATANARPTGVVDHRRHRTPEVEAVVGLLRQPHTARQLVIAQAVLGAPKALEA